MSNFYNNNNNNNKRISIKRKVGQLQGHVTTKIKSRVVSWAQGTTEKLRLEPTPEQLQRCR